MADIGKIRKRIVEIASKQRNVEISEIEWVVDQLSAQGYGIAKRQATHGVLYRVGPTRFMVNRHNPGSAQVKSYSIKDFLDAMMELGLYE